MDGSTFGGVLAWQDQTISAPIRADSEIKARLATTEEVMRDAWSVRHAAYASHGFIDAIDGEIFTDTCDHYPSTKIGVVYRDKKPIGTVRVCLYAPGSGITGADSIPAMEVFGDEIAGLLKATPNAGGPHRAVEVMRLSVHPDIGAEREPVLALFLLAGYFALYFRANAAFCGVRKHHMPLYRRFGWEKKTEPRPYPKLKFETGLMACVRGGPQELQKSMPIMHPVSLQDDIYAGLMRGQLVPVFSEDRSAWAINRMLSGRSASLPLIAERASTRPVVGRQFHDLALAA